MYAISAPTGPALDNGVDMEMNKPVPMVPPNAIIEMCLGFNALFTWVSLTLPSDSKETTSLDLENSDTNSSEFFSFSEEWCCCADIECDYFRKD